MDYKLLIFDAEKCTGCGNCLICPQNAIIYQPASFGHGATLKNILNVKNGRMGHGNELCHQCTDAPCVEACPNKILKKTADGITVLNYDLTEENIKSFLEILEICKNCKEKPCIAACPYHHIGVVSVFIHSKEYKIPIKCDQCMGDPECVKVCPTNALSFVSIQTKFNDKVKLAESLAKGIGVYKKKLKISS
ncbi:MAG: 4Fe-4S dicluster domain-containing protein [Candidatus Helarchaeota archaeon]